MKKTGILIVISIAIVSLTILSLLLLLGAGKREGEKEGGRERAPAGGGDHYSALGIAKPSKEIEAFHFATESLNGKKVRLSDFKGKVVFLNFWATWCGPCKSEVQDINSLHSALKNEDFAVLAVDIREDKRIVSAFMKMEGLDFPVYLDTNGKIASLYGVNGIPTTFIIDPDGKIAGRAIGPRAWASGQSIEFMRSFMKK